MARQVSFYELMSRASVIRVDDAVKQLQGAPNMLLKQHWCKKQTFWHVAAKHGRDALLEALNQAVHQHLYTLSRIGTTIVLAGLFSQIRKQQGSANDTTLSSHAAAVCKILAGTQDRRGRTPLMLACQRGHSSTVKLLLDMGVDIWTADKSRQSALHYACEQGNVETINLLLASASSFTDTTQTQLLRFVNGVSAAGFSPMHYAILSNSLDALKTLLDHGANIELKTTAQRMVKGFVLGKASSALHMAALVGDAALIKAVLTAWVQDNLGALSLLSHTNQARHDPRLFRDHNLSTPLRIAITFKHQGVLHLLDPSTPLQQAVNMQEIQNRRGLTSLADIAAKALHIKLTLDLKALSTENPRCSNSAPEKCPGTASAGPIHCSAVNGDISGDEDEDMCDVCMDSNNLAYIKPCSHRLCVGCAKEICARQPGGLVLCPFCRGPIAGFHTVEQLA